MMQRGTRLTLDVDKPAAGGRMLARHAGQVVLVAGAIPGEQVAVQVERVGKGVAFATVADVLRASPDRRDAAPDWRCGGNAYAHIAYPRQCALKAEIIRDAFARIGRLPLTGPVEVLPSPEIGYRMRARLHVRGGDIGFFREGTHDLCDPGTSGQLLPATLEWIRALARGLQAGRAAGVAAIDIAENIAGDARAAHFELHAGVAPGPYRDLSSGLVGLSAQAADAREPTVLAGTPSIVDTVGTAGLSLRRDVRAFFQGNRFLLAPLVDRVVRLAGPGPVVDLYAGVGLFGLSLAAAGTASVTCVEGDAVSGADLAGNAAPYGDRVEVCRESVEQYLASPRASRHRSRPGEAPQTFVVDPPRTGMTRDAVAGIVRHAPTRIVYVSCDVATLARDARTLVDAGWDLRELAGIDLFPNTSHVESVVLFTRDA